MCPAQALLRERGKGRARVEARAPERGPRSHLPTELRSRPRPSSEKLGEYASTILSCGASAMGGEGVSRGTFTKTTDEKARAARVEERRSRRPRRERSALFSVKPKVSFGVSFHTGPFGKSERSRKGNSMGKGLENRTSACRASNALGAFACSSKRTRHVRAAVPRCAARARRETRGTSRDARSTDARARNRANRALARVPRARASRRARARRDDRRGKSRIPLKQRSFPAPKSRMRAGLWRTVESNARVGSGVISGVMVADPARRASAAKGGVKKSCATRDEVFGERASRENLSGPSVSVSMRD